MKKLFKPFLIAAAMTAVLALAACSDDDDSGSANGGPDTPTATLPASVGTNEVSGKTWTVTKSGETKTLVFTDSTVTSTTVSDKYGSAVDKYRYTYDSEKKLLHLAIISYDEEDGETIASVSDYVALNKKDILEDEEEWTDTLSAYYTAEGKGIFSTVETRQYEIDGSSLKLSTPAYFSGLLPIPSDVYFSGSGIEISNYGRIKIEDGKTKFEVFPTYTNGSFSGTAFTKYGESTAGTIAGTYTTSGEGFSGCTIKLTFTSLPSAITSVTKNTEYTLSQASGSESYETFTLAN